MDRLTLFVDGDLPRYSLWDNSERGEWDANQKLGQYEDAEEQGLLVRLPCKIGDTAWGIRNYRGIKHVQQGVVSEMYFLPDMSLPIVIKHVCRGEFGKTIFLTREEAEQALERKEHE